MLKMIGKKIFSILRSLFFLFGHMFIKVQQLADQTGEESLLLTASLSEGSLSHLGSESGTVFLEDHEDIKSQFLRFCLKSKFLTDTIPRNRDKKVSVGFSSSHPLMKHVAIIISTFIKPFLFN